MTWILKGTVIDIRGIGTGHDRGDHDGFSEMSFIILRGGDTGHETRVI